MSSLPPDHSALLTIDSGALAANWRNLRARAGGAECAAVVKADAYGLGIENVVPALVRAGCCTFFVAHVAEGERVRKAAPDAVIYVLNGLPPGTAPTYGRAQLRPVLGSIDEVVDWSGRGPCALHVDTGMNRLGLAIDDMREVLSGPGNWHDCVRLVMSHLVGAENPEDAINSRQVAAFDGVREAWGAAMAQPGESGAPLFSLANSSGIFLESSPHHDLIRPGYGLYGGNPTPHRPNPMQPVLTLTCSILQVREVKANECVGYNGAWRAPVDSIIATLSLGYADGWLRSLSGVGQGQGGVAIVGGHRCPIVGRVSMDLITLDVTALGQAGVRRGDSATLIGEGLGIDEVGAWAGTNGYEILTSLGRRHRRRLI